MILDLDSLANKLRRIDQESASMNQDSITGLVTTGLGKAATFTNIGWVRTGLLELVGISPWPGTLNLQLSQPSDRNTLMARRGVIDLPGQDGACAAKLLPVTVSNGTTHPVPASVLLPLTADYAIDQMELLVLELNRGYSPRFELMCLNGFAALDSCSQQPS